HPIFKPELTHTDSNESASTSTPCNVNRSGLCTRALAKSTSGPGYHNVDSDRGGSSVHVGTHPRSLYETCAAAAATIASTTRSPVSFAATSRSDASLIQSATNLTYSSGVTSASTSASIWGLAMPPVCQAHRQSSGKLMGNSTNLSGSATILEGFGSCTAQASSPGSVGLTMTVLRPAMAASSPWALRRRQLHQLRPTAPRGLDPPALRPTGLRAGRYPVIFKYPSKRRGCWSSRSVWLWYPCRACLWCEGYPLWGSAAGRDGTELPLIETWSPYR